MDIYVELSQVMDPAAARKLASILDTASKDREQTALRAELSDLRAVVRDLAKAQERTEVRVEELAEAQKRTEQRLEALAGRVDALAGRMSELAVAHSSLERAVQDLTAVVRGLAIRLDDVAGWALEIKFDKKAPAYLGRKMRRLKVLSLSDIGDELDPVLTAEEWDDLSRADSILRGRVLMDEQWQDLYVVAEVSVTLDFDDLRRAARRAALLRKKGWKTLALAAGQVAGEGVIDHGATLGVAILLDGVQHHWDEALAKA
jgi:hypothetical protein